MMGKRKSFFEKLTLAADLPDEPIPRLPLVEIAGDRRVLIENHLGVVAYETDRICVRVTYGTVAVCGSNLELARMIRGQLVITGKIKNVELNGGGKP